MSVFVIIPMWLCTDVARGQYICTYIQEHRFDFSVSIVRCCTCWPLQRRLWLADRKMKRDPEESADHADGGRKNKINLGCHLAYKWLVHVNYMPFETNCVVGKLVMDCVTFFVCLGLVEHTLAISRILAMNIFYRTPTLLEMLMSAILS